MAILAEETFVGKSSKEWNQYKVFDDSSVDETTSFEIDVRNAQTVALHVVSGAGVSGGVVKLEGSPVSGYSGTWKELGSLTVNAANTVFSVSIDQSADGMPIRNIRARIETVISGGTVDAYLTVQR